MINGFGRGSWLSSELLDPLTDVNAHCLELMRQRVRAVDARASPVVLPRVLCDLAPQWNSLDDEAIGRLARMPYILVQSRVGDPATVQLSEVRDGVRERAFFDREQLPGLVRQILVLAWHVARIQRQAAGMILGMEPRQLDVIAGYTLRELDRLAETRRIDVRLRWADRPRVWRHSLSVAIAGDEGGLERARLRGIQLLAAEAWGNARP